ncbi:hypothetical protein FNO01nite_09470 [Flavobacterium noncentrifugens]|uniref:Helix-turn-helix domain-containing protein n=1 Tax=Flavobacterium noncentrifugens TaxID=1128970 RepID=A0A1G8V1U3_9FLAO|nr:helix-turn-helix domain-containing protein [Flavobacterium noncentrifugens]GEP50275.1 hypothetical protein FNO01nite_09470 [Flavobacterium noncentrifugens]SDJ59140.1 Helix-turn-helix domain-containing protein [Flavobacterium noncentrifugens]
MSVVQFIQVTPDQLQSLIAGEIKRVLNEFLKNFTPQQHNEYLTRKQVADLFDIDLSTLNNWSKSGKLSPCYKGNRVYFLRSEIDQSMVRLRD